MGQHKSLADITYAPARMNNDIINNCVEQDDLFVRNSLCKYE